MRYIHDSPKHKARSDSAVRFISPYPLGECVYRVGRLDERRTIPFVPRTNVQFDSISETACQFRIRETGPASLVIHGEMRFWSDRLTEIKADIAVHPITYLEFILIGGGIILFAIFVIWWVAVLFLPPLLWFAKRYRRGLRHEQKRLARLIAETLGDHSQTQ